MGEGGRNEKAPQGAEKSTVQKLTNWHQTGKRIKGKLKGGGGGGGDTKRGGEKPFFVEKGSKQKCGGGGTRGGGEERDGGGWGRTEDQPGCKRKNENPSGKSV